MMRVGIERRSARATLWVACIACAVVGCQRGPQEAEDGLAVTTRALTATVLEEGFEDGLGVFTPQGACRTASDAAAVGAMVARCDDVSSLTTTVDATGFTELRVSYMRGSTRYDAGERFIAELSYDGGGKWVELESFEDAEFAAVSHALDGRADDAVFLLRFRSTASGWLERFSLDAVLVEGETGAGCGGQDDDCDGQDDDCDGVIDEGGDCGGEREVIFEEHFEDGRSGFYDIEGLCTETSDAAFSGPRGVRCDDRATLLIWLPVAGFDQVELSYARRTHNYDPGERLEIAYSRDGVDFSPLQQVGDDGTYRTETLSVPDSRDLPVFVLRFSSNANGWRESFDLDELVVTGVPVGPCVPAGDDVCNGVDDDCDGRLDEGDDCGEVRCNGIDEDADGLVDEGFIAHPTACGLGVCQASGLLECVSGELQDTCVAGPPAAATDYVCNDSDGDCDGLTDEDGDCGGAIVLRMDAGSGDFFGMPWPSDHRVDAQGVPELQGFPSVEDSLFGIVAGALDAYAPRLRGFGRNTAVYFTATGALDPGSLPDPIGSLQDDAAAMLVNLVTGERVPLLADFKAAATADRPGNLLTLLPHPGFPLDAEASYAAIVFDSVRGKGRTVVADGLLEALDSASAPPAGLGAEDFALLREHRAQVDAYVTDHTAHAPQDVLAFAVYTTMPTSDEMMAVGRSIAAMDDAQIAAAVDALVPVEGCPASCEAASCPSATFDATLRLPRWQTPVELRLDAACVDALGSDCMESDGGDVVIDAAGRAGVQRWESNVRARIHVPCVPGQPQQGWPIIIKAGGTGARFDSALTVETQYGAAGRSLDQVVASIVPLHSPGRQDPDLVAQVLPLARLFEGGEPTATDLAGLLFSAVWNPNFASTNQVQSAGEYLFLKRVVALLDGVAAAAGVDPRDSGLPAEGFATDPTRSTYVGQSQGSGTGPLALSIPAGEGGFHNAYLNAPVVLFAEAMVHRGDVRPDVDAVFGLQPGELDHFHPAAQITQLGMERGASLNYAEHIDLEHLLVNAGFQDDCTVRESTQALATALARHGALQAADTSYAFLLDGMPVPQIAGIQTVLQQPLLPLPTAGNLPDGGTGVFLFLQLAHGGSRAGAAVGGFLGDIGQGRTPEVIAPPYDDGSNIFFCGEGRVD